MSRNLLVGKNPSGVYEPVVVDADGRIKMDLAAISHSSGINVNVQNGSIATTGAGDRFLKFNLKIGGGARAALLLALRCFKSLTISDDICVTACKLVAIYGTR